MLVPQLRRARRHLSSPWVLNGAIVVVALVVGALTVAALSVPPPPRQTAEELRTVEESAAANRSEGPSCLGAGSVGDPRTCVPLSDSSALRPDVDELGRDTGRGYRNCLFDYGEARPTTCTFGALRKDAELRVALVGDSHAAMYLGGLIEEATRIGWSLDTYVGQGCRWGARSVVCPSMPRIERTVAREGYDIVLTTSYRGSRRADMSPIAAQVARAWRPVRAAGSEIVVIADTPAVSEAAMRCVTRADFDAASDCSTRLADAFDVQDPLVLAARRSGAAEVVDLTRFLCTESRCPLVRGNVIVYRDGLSHLTGTYARTLAPYLVRAVRQAV